MKNKSLKINALLNGIKTFITIVFPLITFPYITRVLGVENIGKINFATSIIGYFSLIASLGITNYAIRDGSYLREDKEKFGLFARQIFSINVLTTGIAYALLAIAMMTFSELREDGTLIWIQSLSILFTTMGVEWLYSIYEDYLYITIRTIIVQGVLLIMVLMLVKTREDYLRYAWIAVLANGGANILNLFYARKYFKIAPTLKMNLKYHIKPMIILGCNALAITIYVNSDVTILKFMQGDYRVGIYSTAVKIYTVIKQMVNALIIVSLPRLSALYKKGRESEYNELLEKILKALITVLVPIIVGICSFSKEIVLVVSGKDYLESSSSLMILSFAIGFSLLAAFFTTAIMLPHGKEKLILKSTIISAVCNVVLNFFFVRIWAEKGAALTTVLAEFIVMISAIHYSKDDYKMSGIKRAILLSVVGSAGIAAVCSITKMMFEALYLRVVVGVLGSVLVYGILQILMKNEIVFLIFKIVKKSNKVEVKK